MLRSCVCLGRGAKRRSSSLEDTSSCRSSEIERVAKRMETMTVYTKTTSASKTTTTTTSKLQQQQLQQSSGSGRSTTSSLLQFFQSKTWYRHWRKTERSMSMSKTERTFGEIQVHSVPSLAIRSIPASAPEVVLDERPPRPIRPLLIDLRETPRPLRKFTVKVLPVSGTSASESSDEEVTCSG
ncbi:uncharacterized protein LOC129242134 [Anastrepha obliqua]|uniref:uncharacterized protein LOC129242134 n=1 Tax=Anastrepha obliqua TaxID=95512 RepID=UPI002409610B|nr:uncharacterized protein LOC129242134 [Anastrepha obliqua]